eukprot:6188759-Pyramimonas_sp.AAC.1
MVEGLGTTISRATNAVSKRPGHRCAPPKLIWFSAKAVGSQRRVEWESYWRSVRWLLNQAIQTQGAAARKQADELPDILQALGEPPA